MEKKETIHPTSHTSTPSFSSNTQHWHDKWYI